MGTAANRPAAQPAADSAAARPDAPPAAARPDAPPAAAGATDEPMMLEPSEAEADAWAARERQRREGWLSGPTAAERAAWIQGERARRLGRAAAAPAAEAWDLPDLGLYAQRALRGAQLATEGAMSLVWQGVAAEGPVGFPLGLARRWSRRGLAVLVRAGREWEAEHDQPVRGRRVPLPADGEAP